MKSQKKMIAMRDIVTIEAMIVIFLLFFVSFAPAYVRAETPSSINIASSLSTQQALTLLPKVSGYSLSYTGPVTYVQQILEADAILEYSYNSPNSSFTAVVEVLTAPHTPDTSLGLGVRDTGQPYTIYEDSSVQIPVSQSVNPLTGGFVGFLIPNTNQIETILWWNVQSLFNFGSYNDYRNVQIWLIDLPQNQSQIPAVEQSMLPVASKIASWWGPKLTYSVIQTTLKQSSLTLAGVAMLPALALVGSNTIDGLRRKKTSRSNIAGLKSDQEKRLLEALQSLKSKRGPARGTLQEIASAHASTTGQRIELPDALIAIKYLEHRGLVKRKIIDVSGEPVEVWQSSL